MKRAILIITILLFATFAMAAHVEKEHYYQAKWCAAHQGTMEHVLSDKARVDCLTSEYAVEMDFAPHAYESIGQALYYGIKTGKKPGVVLIMEKPGDGVFLERLEAVAKQYGIKVWIVQGVEE
jgi:hypothetical protein